MSDQGQMPKRLPKYCYEDTDRHGTVRCYLRVPGQKKLRLPGSPWSEGFMGAYNTALDLAPAKPAAEIDPRSWAWLCRRYFVSGELRALAPRTRMIRRRILEKTIKEPIEPGSPDRFGDMPATEMDAPNIRVLRDRIGNTPQAANERLKAIRAVFLVGIESGDIQSNPARDVKYIHKPTDGFYTWTEEDIGQYRQFHAPGTKARRALELLLVLGPRRQDVVRLGRQMVTAAGVIKFKPKKTKGTTGVDVEVEITAELAGELDLMPAGRMLFIETATRQPYSVNGFGNWFKRQCVMASLPLCSAHGLRKAGASQRAENGATAYQLMGLYGWESVKTAEVYTKKARRKKLAAGAVGLLSAPLFMPVGQKRENGK